MSSSSSLETIEIGPAYVRWTDARSGDKRMRNAMYVHQVHGTDVVVAKNWANAGKHADAIVTNTPGLTISVQTADCAPIALVSNEGVVAAVHAGYKGLRDGIIERSRDQMRELGARGITAALGPYIHVECYEFGQSELDEFVNYWGASVQGETVEGAPAFNLPDAVAVECKRAGIDLAYVSEFCTGCSGQHFSYRKQKTAERQVMLVTT